MILEEASLTLDAMWLLELLGLESVLLPLDTAMIGDILDSESETSGIWQHVTVTVAMLEFQHPLPSNLSRG